MEIKTQFNFKFKVKDGSEFNFHVVAKDEAEARKQVKKYLDELIEQLLL